MKKKIFITRALFPEVIERLAQHFEVSANHDDVLLDNLQLAQALRDCHGVLSTAGEQLPATIIDASPQLQAIANMAVGYNNIDLAAATRRRILVTNTPDVLNETTADFAWALLMATARRITEAEHWLRAGDWHKWRYDYFLGADLHGSTLGIIGMGRIGQAIARRSTGFGMRVMYYNRSRLPLELEQAANHAHYVDQETLLRSADHVVLTLPYSAQSHHTISAPELRLMKPTAILVNVARGGIVNDAALIAALREQRIAGAGLDVFEDEPTFDPEFLSLKNVVLTPHIASASAPTRRAMANCAADNLIAALTGAVPPNLLNSAALEKE